MPLRRSPLRTGSVCFLDSGGLDVQADTDRAQGEAFLNLLKDDKSGETSDGDVDYDFQFEGALDPILGAAEWRALAGTYERALIRLPNVSSSLMSRGEAWLIISELADASYLDRLPCGPDTSLLPRLPEPFTRPTHLQQSSQDPPRFPSSSHLAPVPKPFRCPISLQTSDLVQIPQSGPHTYGILHQHPTRFVERCPHQSQAPSRSCQIRRQGQVSQSRRQKPLSSFGRLARCLREAPRASCY